MSSRGSAPRPLRSALGWSTPDAVFVRGRNLSEEMLGHLRFGEVVFLHLTGVAPTPQQAEVFDALLVTLLEHGLTPTALATRLTFLGAPESLQGAVAAGLLGLGNAFGGSADTVATMLAAALRGAADDVAIEQIARDLVEEFRAAKRPVPGIGHPVHQPVDPRTERLWEIAHRSGLDGEHVRLIQAISAAAEEATGRRLPVNATGAIGALCCELGLPPAAARGLSLIARCAGLVSHVLEEQTEPIAYELWRRADEEITEAAIASSEQ